MTQQSTTQPAKTRRAVWFTMQNLIVDHRLPEPTGVWFDDTNHAVWITLATEADRTAWDRLTNVVHRDDHHHWGRRAGWHWVTGVQAVVRREAASTLADPPLRAVERAEAASPLDDRSPGGAA